MTAAANPARLGQAAELAVRAVDDLMTWEHQAPRADLTAQDLERIARQLRAAAVLIDGAPQARAAGHGFELTAAGRAAADEWDRDVAAARLILVRGGAK